MTLTAKSMDRSRSFESAIVTPPFCRYYIIKSGVFQVKYSPCGECEIIPLRKLWNIAPSSQCEMKFAHIRVSEYFTFAEQIFHSEAISLARRANFVEKSTHLSIGQMCAFFWWGMVDSDHRSQWQQIYSLPPLAAREIPLIMRLHLVKPFFGAGDRSRTNNLLITNQLLCHWATPASQHIYYITILYYCQ